MSTVVFRFDPGHHRELQILAGLPALGVQHVVLSQGEERLHSCVDGCCCSPSHRTHEPVVAQRSHVDLGSEDILILSGVTGQRRTPENFRTAPLDAGDDDTRVVWCGQWTVPGPAATTASVLRRSHEKESRNRLTYRIERLTLKLEMPRPCPSTNRYAPVLTRKLATCVDRNHRSTPRRTVSNSILSSPDRVRQRRIHCSS